MKEKLKRFNDKLNWGISNHCNEEVTVLLKLKYLVLITIDYIRLNITITDYFDFRFFEKTYNEKKEYLTSKEALRYAIKFDSLEKIWKNKSKTDMYKQLAVFLKRDQLETKDLNYGMFCDYVKKHPIFLYKPDDQEGGIGIQLVNSKSEEVNDLYESLKDKNGIIDEVISQHPILQLLSPGSVNTVRVFTLKCKSEIIYIAAALRMGNGKSVIDNFTSGGMVAGVDIEKGIVIEDAVDAFGKKYTSHPYTGVKIRGLEIPNWKCLKEFVNSCAQKYDLNYVAWDIAIRENDCVLIEANPCGGVHIIQTPGVGGRKKQYKK
ncbi:MAG: sugar-transfer associated ATP-grasp domain-containing protein [Lachnospiraceae bacterium]|nr:sugar-transfer associated ATP-grasp domain-containing protein [Lachnospiraceae bacterium]